MTIKFRTHVKYMSHVFESVYSFRMRTIYAKVLLQKYFLRSYFLHVLYYMFNERIDAWTCTGGGFAPANHALSAICIYTTP